MSAELIPCKCGSKDLHVDYGMWPGDCTTWNITCGSCDNRVGGWSEREVQDKWNERNALNPAAKTHDELASMTVKQLKEYAREIGCCLGYDGSRKDTTISCIEAKQRNMERGEK